jgi:protein-L-isoaspartate(D-aspartate) O-methyltransferase
LNFQTCFEILTFNFTKIKFLILKDTAKHQGLRNQLVSVLQKEITDIKVLKQKKFQDIFFEL